MATARRPARHVVALSAVAALLLTACGEDDDPTVEVAPDEDVTSTETEAPDDETGDDGADDAAGTGDDGAADDAGADDEGAAGGDTAGPTPDPALVEDPCAPDQGREGDAFITVVSPVADQLVDGDTLELVGCSNVFEANVQWTLYDGDGRELDAGYTAAECGSGCVGAYRDQVPLDAAEGEASAELHVYSEDASGGESAEADADGRLHLVTIPIVLG